MGYNKALIIIASIFICLSTWPLIGRAQGITPTMLQELAALQAYMATDREGYAIAEAGIDSIALVRDEEFDLHRDYFEDQDLINPAVKTMFLMDESRTRCVLMTNALTAALDWLSQQKQVQLPEEGNLAEYYRAFVQAASGTMQTMAWAAGGTDVPSRLTDAERLGILRRGGATLGKLCQGAADIIDAVVFVQEQRRRQTDTDIFLHQLIK